jgi:chaperonin GroES
LKELVLIEPLEHVKQTAGGIILPDGTHISQPSEGTVVAAGPGKPLPDGTVRPMTVKVGMFVMHHLYDGTRVKINGREYLLISEDSVHAIITTEIVPDMPIEEIAGELVEAGGR